MFFLYLWACQVSKEQICGTQGTNVGTPSKSAVCKNTAQQEWEKKVYTCILKSNFL